MSASVRVEMGRRRHVRCERCWGENGCLHWHYLMREQKYRDCCSSGLVVYRDPYVKCANETCIGNSQPNYLPLTRIEKRYGDDSVLYYIHIYQCPMCTNRVMYWDLSICADAMRKLCKTVPTRFCKRCPPVSVNDVSAKASHPNGNFATTAKAQNEPNQIFSPNAMAKALYSTDSPPHD